MSYRDALTALGEATEREVLGIFTAFKEGVYSYDEAVALIATRVAVANGQAVVLADLSLAATLMLQLGQPVPTLGLLGAADDTTRLAKAATTLLNITDVTPERIGRLGRAEPLESAANAYSEGIKRSNHTTGWVRGISADACQLCRWWWREGQVWAADHKMPHHKGCTCTPVPVTAT